MREEEENTNSGGEKPNRNIKIEIPVGEPWDEIGVQLQMRRKEPERIRTWLIGGLVVLGVVALLMRDTEAAELVINALSGRF